MKNPKILLLVTLGVLAAAALFFTDLIILGLILGVVPGVILILSPTFFIYYAAALALGATIKSTKVPFPTIVSLIFLIGLGCFGSYLLNRPLVKQVSEFKKLDVSFDGQFEPPRVFAIYSNEYKVNGDICNALCQGLLYNKVSQKVLVVADPSIITNNTGQLVASYEIELGENCTNENLISKRRGKLARPNVESRLAAGECLVKKQEKLSEADVVFYRDKISQNKGYQNYMNLARRVIFISFIELYKNEEGNFKKVYRYSKISAQPFAYPLSFGPILDAGGGGMSLNFGFFHTKLYVNNLGSSYDGSVEDFKPQMERLFGDALGPIKPSEQNIKNLLMDSVESKGAKIAGHSLVGVFLDDFCKGKRVPTDEDLNIVVKALGDDRVDNWHCLNGFSEQWFKNYQGLPQVYLEALVDRILRNGGDYNAAQAIRFLPDGQAANIYPQLEKITQDKYLRKNAYHAVIRLGDAGVKAVPEYINILNEYNYALRETPSNFRTLTLQGLEDASIASVIGLCRLGPTAMSAKEVLYSLLDAVNFRSTIGTVTIDALVEIGLSEELEQKYRSKEDILIWIKRAISQKERSVERGRSFCDRGLA